MKKSALLFVLFLWTAIGFAQKNDKKEIIAINTDKVSLIYGIGENRELLFHHFGKRIDDATPFLDYKSYRRTDHGTEKMGYLAGGGKNFRYPALLATHANGDMNTELVVVSHTQKPSGEGVTTTEIVMKDAIHPFEVKLIIKAFERENVVSQHVEITNSESKDIVLEQYYSAYMPLKSSYYYLNHFHGAWAREMMMSETKLTSGHKSIESRKGVRTTHSENPSFLLSLNTPLAENSGEVIGGALAWSGNFKINFEVDEHNILGITAGVNPYAGAYTLAKGETFVTPDMLFTYSDRGAGDISRNFHDWARNHCVVNPEQIRPTLLNSWEGAYLSFDEKTMTNMIDDAAALGLEMFVLDDGWFGNKYPRNTTTEGLGDWQVNKKKLPRGIGYIADYAVSKGLKFGIWIEPEMVNPKSELAEKHPDWIVKAKGREIPTMRNQWLLDLTNPEVQDFVFGVFDNTMKQSKNISYIKWDANRHVESFGSEYLPDDRQSHFWVDYTKGLYKVYERLRAKYPDVIIQACASGGGRVDYGALKYHNEVWPSDNTDGMSRVFVQYGTNMTYPAIVTGSHISDVPNHQTNLVTPLKFRVEMAMSGRLGMELQPKNLNEQDYKFVKNAIANYYKIRDIVMYGDLYRIESPYNDNGYYATSYISKDKKRGVLFGFCTSYQGRVLTSDFKLNGLDPQKYYRLRELNVEKPTFWGDGKVFSGAYLMNAGLNIQFGKCFTSICLSIEEVTADKAQ